MNDWVSETRALDDQLAGVRGATRRPRSVLRWAGFALLVLLAVRGIAALFVDAVAACMTDELRYVTVNGTWTAFERCVDYNFIPDSDTSLYLARSVEDRATWVRLAPTDTHLMGPMEWKGSNCLCIPAAFRDGCRTRVDDVVIEWSNR